MKVTISGMYHEDKRHHLIRVGKTMCKKIGNRTINKIINSGMFQLQDTALPFHGRDNIFLLVSDYEQNLSMYEINI